ncbi:hypothetical protein H1R20_g4869, partial [Candolleomyces eurysporus]
MKLVGGKAITDIKHLEEEQMLACLSQRLPIEFNSTSYIAQSQQQQQVEGHMRMCLKVDAGFESMVTTSPSEPLLSEAAYYTMCHFRMDCPTTLRGILGGFSVHKGDRGEMVVLLSQMMARDQAVRRSESELYGGIGRSCTVPDFLEALFKSQDILSAKGMVLTAEQCQESRYSLKATFEGAIVYCTHWIKVHQHKIVNTKHLVGLFARGAAVLCGNNHSGIDGVMPYLYKGTKLAASNIGAILWQSKNDEKYGDNPQIDLFTAMDPYSTGLFSTDEPTNVPVIRIVFALAAKRPSISIVPSGKSKSGNSFTTFDIWVAGLSPDVFGVMTHQSQSVWEALLQASHGWKDIYQDVSPREKKLTTRMNPGVAEDTAFWDYWLWLGDDTKEKT